MELEAVGRWDEAFFGRFAGLGEALQAGRPGALAGSVADFRVLFGDGSPFGSMLRWEALLVCASPGGPPLARLIVSANRLAAAPCLACGWLACRADSPEAAALLFQRAEAQARAWGCPVLKAPLQGHFMHSYRLKLPGGGDPFHGEPDDDPLQHRLLQEAGFEVTGRWDTIRIDPTRTLLNFERIRRSLTRRTTSYAQVRTRPVRLWRWEEDLRIVYDLISSAYTQMPEFEPVTWEAFRLLGESFRYVIHPLSSFIFEYRGEPVGFAICYFDPLPVLQQRAAGRGLAPALRARLPALLADLVGPRLADLETLVRLKLNSRRLLLAYVGRVEPRDGARIKGVQSLVSRPLYFLAKLLRTDDILVTYLAAGSASRKSYDQRFVTIHSSYVLYGKQPAS